MPKIKKVLVNEVLCLDGSRATSYSDYLETRHWKTVRESALIEAEFMCQKCRSQDGLHVHHLTYERIGEEIDSDLMVLCSRCHIEEHMQCNEKSYHPWRKEVNSE